MINELTSQAEFDEILRTSTPRPVFLFKHSTACSTSTGAWRDFQRLAETEARADYWRVLVIENRALSQQVAKQTSLRHESPQVLLFHKGRVVWHESHWRISVKALQKSLEVLLAPVA